MIFHVFDLHLYTSTSSIKAPLLSSARPCVFQTRAGIILLPYTQDLLAGDIETKFALFSGHDTVIAPLLAALGAYDCHWPPYASHIAFELWSKPAKASGVDGRVRGRRRKRAKRALADEEIIEDGEQERDAADEEQSPKTEGGDERNASEGELVDPEKAVQDENDEGEDVGKSDPGGNSQEVPETEESYVRVTFNGEPVTHRIKFCGEALEER